MQPAIRTLPSSSAFYIFVLIAFSLITCQAWSEFIVQMPETTSPQSPELIKEPIAGTEVKPLPAWASEFLPLGFWLEAWNQRTPYNEDEIVGLLNELADVTMKLSITNKETQGVDYPPPGGHPIDRDFWQGKWARNDAVYSLMKRLPYPKGYEDIHWAWFTVSPDYRLTKPEELHYSGPWVDEGGHPLPPELAPPGAVFPQDVLIAVGDHSSTFIFLDTAESAFARLRSLR